MEQDHETLCLVKKTNIMSTVIVEATKALVLGHQQKNYIFLVFIKQGPHMHVSKKI